MAPNFNLQWVTLLVLRNSRCRNKKVDTSRGGTRKLPEKYGFSESQKSYFWILGKKELNFQGPLKVNSHI